MGQDIKVAQRTGSRPEVVVFDLNRSLTGMGHERYYRGSDITGVRPCDELARRLLADERVSSVHVYSNVVTVELGRFASSEGLAEVIESLFTYYVPGVEVAEPAELAEA